MDFQRFAIDERLARAVESLSVKAVFYEEMLEHVVLKNENVCAKIAMSEGREEVCLLPALQWLATDPARAATAAGEVSIPLAGVARRVLVAVPEAETAGAAVAAAKKLGSGLGIAVCLALEGDPADPAAAPVLEGDPAACIVVGTPMALLAAAQAGELKLRDYGFLVVFGAERLAELPSELVHKFAGALLPSWERRSILASSKITVKAKNLAWDLADNPSEIHIEEEVVKALGVPRETWYVAVETKFRFLLGLLGRESAASLCVFCNLRGTVEEVSRRLEANGIGTDYILGSLPVDRKLAILGKTRNGACRVLVLTDQGAEGLPPASFPLVVNYDIPLEPEYFVKRLELLEREKTGSKVVNLACDRYICGLTAVEQYIDAKLDTVTADDSLLAAEDKSEGMSIERNGSRRPGRGFREDTRREDTRRETSSREDTRRDAHPRDDRSPAIRRSISEATGGSLDIESVGQAPRESEPPRGGARRGPAQSESQGSGGRAAERHDGQKGSSSRREAHRRDSAQSGPGKRDGRRGGTQRNAPKPQAPRRDDRSGSAAGARSPRGSVSGNPYDLPMEERMRRYREKYGRRLEGERSDEARIAKIRDAKVRDARTREEQGRGTPHRNDRGGAPRPEARQEPRPAPAPERREGLFGRLRGVLKKKSSS